jgi:hypothetical protein
MAESIRPAVLAAARALHAEGVYPSHPAVARRVGCLEATVSRHHKALKAVGLWPDVPPHRGGKPRVPDLSGLDLADAGPRRSSDLPIGRFGCLSVVGFDDAYTARTGKRHWRCVCSICGARSVHRADILAAGTYRKCGPGCPGLRDGPACPVAARTDPGRPSRPPSPADAVAGRVGPPEPPLFPRSTEKASPDTEAIRAQAKAIKDRACASILPPVPKPAEAPPPPPSPASAVEKYRAEWRSMRGRMAGSGGGPRP